MLATEPTSTYKCITACGALPTCAWANIFLFAFNLLLCCISKAFTSQYSHYTGKAKVTKPCTLLYSVVYMVNYFDPCDHNTLSDFIIKQGVKLNGLA